MANGRIYLKGLYAARKNSGLTQKELAPMCGIPRSSFSKYERCGSTCPSHLVPKIAEVLGVSLTFLQNGPPASFRLPVRDVGVQPIRDVADNSVPAVEASEGEKDPTKDVDALIKLANEYNALKAEVKAWREWAATMPTNKKKEQK